MMIETNQTPKDTGEKTAKKKLTRKEQLKMLLRHRAGVMIAWVHKSPASQPIIASVAFSTLRKTGIAIERLEAVKAPVHRIAREA